MKKTYKIKSLPQTKKSNLIKVNFKKGGSIPKYQTGTPTYADSLALYNNALAKDAYYRNQKDYKLLQTYLQSESPFTEENLKYAADHTRYEREYIENYMLEDPEVFPELTKDHLLDRIKKISNTLYSTSDFLGLDESNGTLGGYDYIYDPNLKPTKLSAHDHRTNPDAPPILYSPYILPQGALHYSHNDIYDLSMVPYYDPVMVKPWNMLTKKEKEFRRKVEKEGYVFTNPYPEDNSTGTTDPNISVDVRFRKLGLDSSFSNRKKVAEQAGIENYKGTAEQNKALNEWIVENYNPETKTFKTENIDSLPIDSLPIKRQTQLTNIQPQLTNKSTKDSEPQERTKQVPKYFWEQLPNGTWVKRKFIDVGKTDTFEFQKGGIKVNFQKGGSIPKYQKGNQKYNIQKPKPIGYYQNTLDPEVSESTAVENIFRPTEEQITKDREHIKRVGDLTKAIKEETGVSHNQAVQNAQMIIENEMKGQPSMQAMPTRLQGKAQEEFSKKVMDDSWTLSDYMALPLDLMSTFSPPSDETRYQRRFRRYNPNTSALDKLKESTSEALSLAPSAALNVGLTLAAMPGASASTIAAESMLPFSTSLQKAALNLEPIPAFVKSLPIRRAANYTPGLVRYVDDVIGTTKMKGKFSLPKYQNTYRIEHPDVNMTSTADDVTGRWFLKTPNTNDTGFYLENLKDPTGKVIKNPPGAVYGFSSLENPSKVRIMTQRLPEYKINQQFGAGMPEEARIMSMGRGDMTNAQLDEVIGAGAGDRFTEGKFLWTDYNAMETAPFLYHPSEGILNASQVNKLRTGNTGILSGGKSQVFDNQAEAFKYFLNESEAAKNVFSKFRQRLPFQKGGIKVNFQKGGSIPKYQKGNQKYNIQKPTFQYYEKPLDVEVMDSQRELNPVIDNIKFKQQAEQTKRRVEAINDLNFWKQQLPEEDYKNIEEMATSGTGKPTWEVEYNRLDELVEDYYQGKEEWKREIEKENAKPPAYRRFRSDGSLNPMYMNSGRAIARPDLIFDLFGVGKVAKGITSGLSSAFTRATGLSGLGEVLSTPAIIGGRALPGVTLGNALDLYAATQIPGLAKDTYTNLSEGNYWDAAATAGEGALYGLGFLNPMWKQGAKSLVDDFANTKIGNKIATGNSPIPYAWKVETPKEFVQLKNRYSLTDDEAEALHEYIRSPYAVKFNEKYKNIINNLAKSNPTIFDDVEKNVITRVIGHSSGAREHPTKYGSVFNYTPGTTRSWSLGIDPKFANTSRQRLVIPSKYSKDLKQFFAVPYNDPKLGYNMAFHDFKRLKKDFPHLKIETFEDYLKSKHYLGSPTMNFQSEKELLGLNPFGWKVIGRANDQGFDNIFIKPLTKANKNMQTIASGSQDIPLFKDYLNQKSGYWNKFKNLIPSSKTFFSLPNNIIGSSSATIPFLGQESNTNSNAYKQGGSIPKFNFKKGYRRVYEEDSGSTEFGKKKVIDVYRPMFGTSKTIEKDITYASDDEPRKKFTEREVTKTFNDGSLKSYKMIRRKDGKLLKEYSTPKQTFEKGEMPHNLIQKIGYPKIF